MPSPTTPPRYRVIEGVLYARNATPYAYDLRVHDLGHGQVEATVLPRYGWGECDALTPGALSDAAMAAGNFWIDGVWSPASESAEDKLDKLARNQKRSSRRARTQVRRLCKFKGLTTMLTLTYRENMLDRDRMARDFDVFVKRVRRVVPDFQYLCVFERQKRGAWHAHIAVPRVLSHYLHKGHLARSYDLLRSMWRGVVGSDNGNVDVSRNRRVSRSAAKLAAYMSKYISKGFGDGTDGNSYRASGRALPRAVYHCVLSPTVGPAVEALLDLLSVELGNPCQFHHALLDGGGYFVSLSPK